MSRAPHPIYNDGWDDGVASVNAELAKRERPTRWARAELARLRSLGTGSPTIGLRDDWVWGWRDGASTTLANYLYRIDDVPESVNKLDKLGTM